MCSIHVDWWLHIQVNISNNHNFLRTVGFLAVLAAVTWQNKSKTSNWYYLPLAVCKLFFVMEFCYEVRNCKKHGLVFFAPPCSTWVFLMLCCNNGKKTSFIMALWYHSAFMLSLSCGQLWFKMLVCIKGPMTQIITQHSGHLHRLGEHGYHQKVIERNAFNSQTSFAWGCFICPLVFLSIISNHSQETKNKMPSWLYPNHTKHISPIKYWSWMRQMFVMTHPDLRLWYAWQNDIFFLIEQPISSDPWIQLQIGSNSSMLTALGTGCMVLLVSKHIKTLLGALWLGACEEILGLCTSQEWFASTCSHLTLLCQPNHCEESDIPYGVIWCKNFEVHNDSWLKRLRVWSLALGIVPSKGCVFSFVSIQIGFTWSGWSEWTQHGLSFRQPWLQKPTPLRGNTESSHTIPGYGGPCQILANCECLWMSSSWSWHARGWGSVEWVCCSHTSKREVP